MKVIIKCGGDYFLQQKIRSFFFENILPVLDWEIAIELTNRSIYVFDKIKGENRGDFDCTVEIIVELNKIAISMALNKEVSKDMLKKEAGDFFDEAIAIRKIEELNPFFSREYYSCDYRRGSGIKEG